MGIVEDIMSFMRKGPRLLSKLDGVKVNTKSVARGANDSTFQFPCLISDTIPINVASTVVRTLDKVYATFVQTWLSLHPTIDISMENPLQYIKKFHQNIKFESVDNLVVDESDIEGYMEKVYNGDYKLFLSKDRTEAVLFNVADKSTREMLESHKEYLKPYLSEFDTSGFTDLNMNTYTEADSDGVNKMDLIQASIHGQMKRYDDENRDRALRQSDRMRTPQLNDRDVKKANDIAPFAMQVRLLAVNEKGEFVQYMDFVIGIKAIMHAVKCDEIIANITRTLQNKNVFFKLLRWTSGEISLFKNIILDLDNIRMDAHSSTNHKTPWFSTLRRLKGKKVGLHSGTVPHGVIPNSTVVISSYEANYLDQTFGIDVRSPKVAKKLISGLFLMSFIIIDDSTGTVDILYDGSDAYQTYSLETLEREVAMSSNSLAKEIGRMISH